MGGGGNGAPGSASGKSTIAKRDPFLAQKRFIFTGLITLEYLDYSTETSGNGRHSKSGWTDFIQRYSVGVKGYAYHPRLMVFSAEVSYDKAVSESENGQDTDSKGISYDFSATLFQARPLTLSVNATKFNSDYNPSKSSSYNTEINYYAARLLYATRKYPIVRLEYSHWDTTIDRMSGRRVMPEEDFWDDEFGEEPPTLIIRGRVKDKSSIDRYSLDINGEMKGLRTRYFFGAFFSDITNPQRSFTSKGLRVNTYSLILRKHTLHTSLSYLDYDYMKLSNISSYLTLAPFKKLYHSYGYDYYSSETSNQESATHTMRGSWIYRLSNKIYGKADVSYRTGDLYNIDYTSYDANLGVYYARPIKAFDFMSSYNFNTNEEDRLGKFSTMLNSISFSLATRRLRMAKLYAEYHFSYRTLDFNPDSEETGETSGDSTDIAHRLLLGGNGKFLKKINWILELEARFVDTDSDQTGAWQSIWFGESQWGQKIRHYTVKGEIRLPLWRKADAVVRSEYTTGTTDSEDVLRYFYEFRLRYAIRKNMNLSAWWREEYRNAGWWQGTFSIDRGRNDLRERYYEIILTYLWRRTFLSVEYSIEDDDDSVSTSKVKRLYISATRRFSW